MRELKPVISFKGQILPLMAVPVIITKEHYNKIIKDSLEKEENLVVMFLKEEENPDDFSLSSFYNFGVEVRVIRSYDLFDSNLKVVFEGIKFVKPIALYKNQDNVVGYFEEVNFDFDENDVEIKPYFLYAIDLFKELVKLSKNIDTSLIDKILTTTDKRLQIYSILSILTLTNEEIEKVLNFSTKFLIKFIVEKLFIELENTKLKKQIEEEVRKKIEETQKKIFLSEQLKIIKKELGESETSEIDEFKNKLDEIFGFDEQIKEKIRKEIEKLENTPPHSSEYGVIYNYLKFVFELPWQKETSSDVDFKDAINILENSHFGMEKAKEVVEDYLSILLLTKKTSKSILCFVGPPGVGKTSLAQAIAVALKKKFVRMSLGGLHDEAEIRGHRKTYIGAMPGQIIRKIHECGVKNPVFLLDEIDKLGSDYKGDPSHALLEVLDPEQNNKFYDNYLEIPFDLSKVLFITTANSVATIPQPLLDRMEIVEIPSYLLPEKVIIAQRYLLPKILKSFEVEDKFNIKISDKILEYIVEHYTKEAGVRQLYRLLEKIVKKISKEILSEKIKPKKDIYNIRITTKKIKEYLGEPRYYKDLMLEEDEIGIVTGLAWTQVGGDILFIQSNIYDSEKENLILTGRLGEVMKESARIALSVAKWLLSKKGLSDKLKNKEIHIHVPEQSLPKEGPSAGVALVTSLISSILEIPVKRNVAMTGEINLRGDVLPIGGLREKLTAAKNAGINTVLIPYRNKKDLEEIPKYLIEDLSIIPVKKVEEVLKIALKDSIF